MSAERTAFDHGRLAAIQGCYRILCNPDSPEQESEWKRGWDSVPVEDRKETDMTLGQDAFDQIEFSDANGGRVNRRRCYVSIEKMTADYAAQIPDATEAFAAQEARETRFDLLTGMDC